jgi:hypothetical protein
MTSRRNVSEGRFTDALDDLIRWTLHDSVGQVRPPACVWERIERKAQRRVTARAGWHALAGVWAKVEQNLRCRMTSQARGYAGRDRLVQPMIFSVWEGRVPLSLVCIIEQQMPIPRLGWVT